ncbi:MAG: hypothetical protein SVV03_04885 [Candidatus Nanohaloarchaea archaeon]|nr:hypothetical protein [Candidatus Nanohaloarchaea archaeon]
MTQNERFFDVVLDTTKHHDDADRKAIYDFVQGSSLDLNNREDWRYMDIRGDSLHRTSTPPPGYVPDDKDELYIPEEYRAATHPSGDIPEDREKLYMPDDYPEDYLIRIDMDKEMDFNLPSGSNSLTINRAEIEGFKIDMTEQVKGRLYRVILHKY